ncbi:MAG: hypothetical protein HY548_05760 [Elusimicrobia bacterium]|nr:hypothetical protein [Elusimicrobiota bacterium]
MTKMKRVSAVLAAVLLGLAVSAAWAFDGHGGHGGHVGGGYDASEPSGGSHSDDDHTYERIQKFEKKKMKIETRLQDPKLKPAKRAKLEKELKKLKNERFQD